MLRREEQIRQYPPFVPRGQKVDIAEIGQKVDNFQLKLNKAQALSFMSCALIYLCTNKIIRIEKCNTTKNKLYSVLTET